MSGSELAKAKEVAAQKMREKQAAGMHSPDSRLGFWRPITCTRRFHIRY